MAVDTVLSSKFRRPKEFQHSTLPMSRAIPIYRDVADTYHADACQPLVTAAASQIVQLEALSRGQYPGRRLPKDALPGVKTIGYWNAANAQDWGLSWHRNEGIEFTFLESGSLGFAVDNREYTLQPDDLTVTRPWQLHRVGNPNVGPGRLHWLIIDVGVRRPNQVWTWPSWLILNDSEKQQLTNVLRNNERPVWAGSQNIRRCFQAVAHAIEADREGSNVSRLAVRLNDFFLMLLDLFRSYRIRLDESLSGSRRTVRLFLEDLVRHPEHLAEDWTVESMATSCGLGVSQFTEHVNRLTNLAPRHYLNECRLDLSAKLLRDCTESSVTEVALRCGFSSSQYFATLFGRRFGLSPRDFRRKLVNGEAYGRRIEPPDPRM